MLRLFLKRSESEPIRESYFRKYVYFLLDDILYRKRHSWGRISQDDTVKIVLPKSNIDQVRQLLNNKEILKNRTEEHSIPQFADLELRYKLKLLYNEHIVEQYYQASGNMIWEQYEEIQNLWRLLEQLVTNPPYTSDKLIKKAEGFEFNLAIEEGVYSDRGYTVRRTYELKNDSLIAQRIRTGKKAENLRKEIHLNPYEIGCLYQSLQEEWEHINRNKLSQSSLGNYINPAISVKFSGTIQGQVFQSQIEGQKLQLAEKLPMLAVESFENSIQYFL